MRGTIIGIAIWFGCGMLAFGALNARSCSDITDRAAYSRYNYSNQKDLDYAIRRHWIVDRGASVFGPVSLMLAAVSSGGFQAGLKFTKCECKLAEGR